MRLGPLLEGPKQYVVPYFQRAYSWRRRQWTTLFDDILELYELGSRGSHFLGSMVLLAENNEADPIPHTLVIDGQQRIVTLSLFLAAIRDVAKPTDAEFADHLHNEYLVNDTDTVKVVTTHGDRDAFSTVVKTRKEPDASPIRDAYRTFKEAIQEQVEKGVDLDRLVHIIVSQLSFV